jgi:hypothetical protein
MCTAVCWFEPAWFDQVFDVDETFALFARHGIALTIEVLEYNNDTDTAWDSPDRTVVFKCDPCVAVPLDGNGYEFHGTNRRWENGALVSFDGEHDVDETLAHWAKYGLADSSCRIK